MGSRQTIEEYPFPIIESTGPLIDYIRKKIPIWYKKGPYVELPILCPYDYDPDDLIGQIVQSRNYQIMIKTVSNFTGVFILKMKIGRR